MVNASFRRLRRHFFPVAGWGHSTKSLANPRSAGPIAILSGDMRGTLRIVFLSCTILGAQTPLNLNNLDFEAIDRSCRPCDDFYRFSIGKWNDAHPIPATQTRWSKRWAGADASLQVLRTISEDLAGRKSPAGSNEQMIGDFYAACTDTTTIDSQGFQPIAPVLKRIASLPDKKALQEESCVERADSMIGDVLGKEYVDKVFPPAAKARMQEMVKFLASCVEPSTLSK
jgi:predicted metalloendopeptidase